VRRSLVELAEYASRLGIRLGLESRDHYHEIPLPDELDYLLDLGYDEVTATVMM
jgi:sugar phosphate isomerase/epimerase